MEDIRNNAPRPLFDSIGLEEKGIRFILGYLKCHKDEDIKIADLARELGVSTARMSVLIGRMEADKLVRKIRSKKDARQVMVKITAAGEKIADEHFETLVRAYEKLIDSVSEEDLRNYVRVSGIIKGVLKNAKAGDKTDEIV